MGASQDKEAGSPSAEYAPYQDSTPSKETGVYKRQLPFDPRSPTDNIARTPIVIEDTSEALTELDPRSPTIGIERTPLTILSKGNDCGIQLCVMSFAEVNLWSYNVCPLRIVRI